MNLSDMTIIERRLLGALIMLADENGVVNASIEHISKTIGYKKSGGYITLALRLLEVQGYIQRIDRATIRVLV